MTFDATNGFDEGHRLTKETVSNALYRWTGTVTGSTAYSPDRLNRYASVGGTGFSYDANANLASDGTWTFGYDPENWLLTAAKTGTSASYLYDPLGRRVKSTVGSGSTVFLHADDEEIGEYGAGGGLQLRYIPGPEIDRPIGWVTSNGAKRFFHADRRGSIIAVTTTTSGLSEGPYSYDAYGLPSATTGTPIKYTGRRYDAETGLYYYRARYYSPALGRFMQTNPVGYEAGMNLYEYVQDDPINEVDPTGECGLCLRVAVAVAACGQNANCRTAVGLGGGFALGAGSYAVNQAAQGKPINLGTALKEGVKGATIGAYGARTLNAQKTAKFAAAVEAADRAQASARRGDPAGMVAAKSGVGAAEAYTLSLVGGKVAETASPVAFPTQEGVSNTFGAIAAPIVASGTQTFANSANKAIENTQGAQRDVGRAINSLKKQCSRDDPSC